MKTFSSAHTAIEVIIEPTTSRKMVPGGSVKACRSPNSPGTQVINVSETIVPIMNTSPWAKLINSMMP